MKKKLTKWDYELLAIALEKWHSEVDKEEHFTALSETLQELGEYLASKNTDGWGTISRYDKTR